jgi:hypothetical protein
LRWIAITLLALNLGYLVWRWLGAEPQGSATPAEASRPHRIELAALEPTAFPEPATRPEAPPPTNGQTSASASASVPESVPDPAAIAIPETPAVEPVCYWSAWAEAALPLPEGFEAIQEERREQELGRRYLVWIPPKPTREATLERLRELKQLAIDSAFIDKGEQAGGISLGLFSSEEAVHTRLQEAKALRIDDAQSLTRVRTQSQTRTLIRTTAAGAADGVGEWEKTGCPAIASQEPDQ